MKARVIVDYDALSVSQIAGQAGDKIAIIEERTTNVAGWVWGINAAGQGGWVPEAYLDRQGSAARLRCDYDAVELTVRVGDRLEVHKTESGFHWVTHEDGRQGWVPATHVKLEDQKILSGGDMGKQEALRQFLVQAKANGYASGRPGTIGADGCHELVFQAGEFKYRDSYFGEDPFVGEEVVWQNDRAIWAMNFYGSVTGQAVPAGEVYTFLQKALRQMEPEQPYRGPSIFREQDFEYCNEAQGSLDRFTGVEQISFRGQVVYQLLYHGGAVG